MASAPTEGSGPPLRIGILGCARIAQAFARDLAGSRAAQVVAVASRSAATAAGFAAEFGIPRHHGSYEALLHDPGVDAVYIPLPNSLHAPWSIAASRAGKHVLCEKPLATRATDARAMFAAAQAAGTMLLEAYPYWFQPQTGALVALLQQGAIGEVRHVQASFGFTLRTGTDDIRLQPELGGGALLDAGSYPMSLIRLAMGSAPRQVCALATTGPSGVDIATVATLDWGDGRRAQLSCAMDLAVHRHAVIVGTQGVIDTDYLNHTGGPPSRMRLRRGAGAGPFEEVTADTGSGFRFAAEAFARVVAARDHEAIARAAAASIDIAATLEAIAASAAAGGAAVAVELPGA